MKNEKYPSRKKKLKLELKKGNIGYMMRKHLLACPRMKGIHIFSSWNVLPFSSPPHPRLDAPFQFFFSILIYFKTFFPLKLMIRYIYILRILCSSIYYISGGLRLWTVVSLIKMDILYGYVRMRSYENKQDQRSSSSSNTSTLAPSQHHPNVLLLDNIHKKIWPDQDEK